MLQAILIIVGVGLAAGGIAAIGWPAVAILVGAGLIILGRALDS